MMLLDRALQQDILCFLAESYPNHRQDDIRSLLPSSQENTEKIIANLFYLEQHGLVEAGLGQTELGKFLADYQSITAKGMDFITEDGGLSAILGIVTIRLHDQTVRALLEAKIESSDLTPEDKPKWTAALRSLPADAIKHLTMKLLESGLTHAPGAIHEVGKFLGF